MKTNQLGRQGWCASLILNSLATVFNAITVMNFQHQSWGWTLLGLIFMCWCGYLAHHALQELLAPITDPSASHPDHESH